MSNRFQPAPVESSVSKEQRERQIAEAAYYLAERDGFPPGHEQEYWLRAEAMLSGNEATQTR